MTLDTPDERSDFWDGVIKLSLWCMEVYALAARTSELAPPLNWTGLDSELSFLEEETRDYLLPSSLDARLLAALQRQLDALMQTRFAAEQPPQELIDEWTTTTYLLLALTDREAAWDDLRLLHRYKPAMLARHLAAINIAPEEIPKAFTWPLEQYTSEPKPPTGEEAEQIREKLAQIRAGTLPDEPEWL